ncbi:hypothetical protein GUJ93_ZPchr0006g44596 [Zizania palustris]|uniref:Uncharacterized protein n=1 Tax=Zizania palustris TaxID=103762 RepID=A0A8J5W323_ZIZPA|nr:hypothetical protein GUJ93_ZPchr0006g44596 [Zizania palustris]
MDTTPTKSEAVALAAPANVPGRQHLQWLFVDCEILFPLTRALKLFAISGAPTVVEGSIVVDYHDGWLLINCSNL